jgi:glutathione S-transferase
MGPRYELYVKMASDGKSVRDFPFSQYANMVAHAKIPPDQFRLVPVDLNNKPPDFLTLNPKGSVPVLVDTTTQKVIADSQLIVEEICKNFPELDMKVCAGPE